MIKVEYNVITGERVETPLTEAEIASLQPTPEQRAADLRTSIVASTQSRLDDFARTRNYDGILSLCTYATSPTARFASEGQYGVNLRDATWSKLYDILSEIQAGTRPMPNGYSDIESELPLLQWPI